MFSISTVSANKVMGCYLLFSTLRYREGMQAKPEQNTKELWMDPLPLF